MSNKNTSTDLRLILYLELLAVVVIICLGVLSQEFSIPIPMLTANPISFLKAPFYQGILHRLGLMFWSFIVIINLFTYSIIYNKNYRSKESSFLLFSSLFFGFFMLDEMLLIHNYILPKLIGIHQLMVLIIYAILALLFLLSFKQTIVSNFSVLFFAAISFLGLSMLIDILSYLKIIKLPYRYFLDDSLKFLGIFNLFIYFFIFNKNKFLKTQ